jgi:hypothetical protein
MIGTPSPHRNWERRATSGPSVAALATAGVPAFRGGLPATLRLVLRSRWSQLVAIVVAGAVWSAGVFALIEETSSAVVSLGFILGGPAWAYAFCLASDEADFSEDASRGREEWLRVLPWTFVLAPLVLPNLVLLVSFFRDARADSGRTWLGSGRSHPGTH